LDVVGLIDQSLEEKTAMVLLSGTLTLDGTKKDSFRGEERKDQIKRKPSPKDDFVGSVKKSDIRCFFLPSQIRNQDGNFYKTKCLALPRIPQGAKTLWMLSLHIILTNSDIYFI